MEMWSNGKHSWRLVLMDVTKDTTMKVYECGKTGIRKHIKEYYKYTQYNSRLDKTEVTYYDSEGQLMDGYVE